MNNSQIESELKKYYAGTELANIDFRNNIMNSVRSRKAVRSKWFTKAAIVSLAMLFTLSVTFAGTQILKNIFSYKDNHGDTAWRYDIKTPANGISEVESEYRDIFNYVRGLKLKPGKSVAVFKKSKVEQGGVISAYTEPVSTIYEKKFREMLKDRADFLKICNSIPEGYKFLVGTVKYRPTAYDQDSLRKEGQASGQDLYIKEIETETDNILYVGLDIGSTASHDKNFGLELKTYEAKNYTPDQMFYGSVGSAHIVTETVKLANVEGSYMKYGNGTRHQILWLQKGENSKFIVLEGRTSEIAKEDLIKMALEIEEKYKP